MRPSDSPPGSVEDVEAWLRYLCVNSTCRGLGGHELAEAPLVKLPALEDEVGPIAADRIRTYLRSHYRDPEMGDAGQAKLNLLGLTASSMTQSRAVRRRRTAEQLSIPLDTFQHGANSTEALLLRDVAADLWGQFACPAEATTVGE